MTVDCVICLDVMDKKNHEENEVLTCAHLFHKKCIQDWLKKSQACPICRERQGEVGSPVLIPLVRRLNVEGAVPVYSLALNPRQARPAERLNRVAEMLFGFGSRV